MKRSIGNNPEDNEFVKSPRHGHFHETCPRRYQSRDRNPVKFNSFWIPVVVHPDKN